MGGWHVCSKECVVGGRVRKRCVAGEWWRGGGGVKVGGLLVTWVIVSRSVRRQTFQVGRHPRQGERDAMPTAHPRKRVGDNSQSPHLPRKPHIGIFVSSAGHGRRPLAPRPRHHSAARPSEDMPPLQRRLGERGRGRHGRFLSPLATPKPSLHETRP